MKKITNKKYEAIIQAKNIISQLCEDGAMDYVESGVDVVRATHWIKEQTKTGISQCQSLDRSLLRNDFLAFRVFWRLFYHDLFFAYYK